VRRYSVRLLMLALVMGCVQGIDDDAAQPAVDEKYFECKVQPILTKSCSMFACHGDGARFFRLYARNRLRLGFPEAERNHRMSPEERAHNFAAARAFVDPEEPERSLLLMKPLDQKGGGYYHGGATEFGKGDVFPSRNEAEFKVLENWIKGEKGDPACIEPGSES